MVSPNGPVWRPYLGTPFMWDQGNGQVAQVIEHDVYVFVFFSLIYFNDIPCRPGLDCLKFLTDDSFSRLCGPPFQ